MGWWGPIADKAGIKPAGQRPIFAGLLIALLGAVTVSAGTIAFSCLYIGRWEVAAVAGAVTVGIGLSFKFGYVKYMRYLHAEEQQPTTRQH